MVEISSSCDIKRVVFTGATIQGDQLFTLNLISGFAGTLSS